MVAINAPLDPNASQLSLKSFEFKRGHEDHVSFFMRALYLSAVFRLQRSVQWGHEQSLRLLTHGHTQCLGIRPDAAP